MQAGFLRDWLSDARVPVPVMLETSGMLPAALAEVVDLIDVVSMDLKTPIEHGRTGILEPARGVCPFGGGPHVVCQDPGHERSQTPEFERAVDLLARVDPGVPVFLQPISDEQGRPLASEACLSRFHALARRTLHNVRVVPQTHKLLGLR